MHLNRQSACFRLTLPLTAGALAKAGQILLADRHIAGRVAGAGIVHQHLQVHLGLAAQTLDISLEVSLIGADRAAQRVVVLKRGAETKWQNSGKFEAVRNHAGVVSGRLLIQPGAVFGRVLGDDDSKIAGRKEKRLITEDP